MTTTARVLCLCAAAVTVLTAGVSTSELARGGAQVQTGTATLRGRVVRGESLSRTPVGRVTVSISASESSRSLQTVTDDQGGFVFNELPAGGYLIRASRIGWVTTFYGSPRPGRPPGVRVAVADGAKVNLEIPIVPGSVIGGRIIDENGQPMARLFPWLLERRLVGDRQILARMRNPYGVGFFEQMTNDLGEFRLFGLPPGTYHLVVEPSILSGARLTTQDEVRWALQPPGPPAGPAPALGAVAGYARFYFPGTPDPTASQAIIVGPGEVRDGLTFRIGFIPVVRVEGTVRREDGASAAGTRVSLDARVPQVSLEGSTRTVVVAANGSYVFQNVPPGDYRLSTRSAPQAPPRPGETTTTPAPLLWAQTDVLISGQDLQGVDLTLAPAPSMSGRLTFTATTVKPPADVSVVRLQFSSVENLAAALTGGSGSASPYPAIVEADGSFRVPGLPPGRYIPSATWPGIRNPEGAGWWLTNVAVAARDLGDAPIEVRPGEEVTNVTIGFRDRIGAVEGLLADSSGRPAPGYFVLVFPAERESWTMTSRRALPAVRPGTDGRFRVTGLPAGQYYVAVVTTVEPDDAMDPALLEAILPSAIRITIKEGETVRQDLKIGR